MFTESGICPECNSTDIEFGDIYWNDLNLDPSIDQECRCLNCGCEFKEHYNTKYTNMEVTWHGEKYKPETEEKEN